VTFFCLPLRLSTTTISLFNLSSCRGAFSLTLFHDFCLRHVSLLSTNAPRCRSRAKARSSSFRSPCPLFQTFEAARLTLLPTCISSSSFPLYDHAEFDWRITPLCFALSLPPLPAYVEPPFWSLSPFLSSFVSFLSEKILASLRFVMAAKVLRTFFSAVPPLFYRATPYTQGFTDGFSWLCFFDATSFYYNRFFFTSVFFLFDLCSSRAGPFFSGCPDIPLPNPFLTPIRAYTSIVCRTSGSELIDCPCSTALTSGQLKSFITDSYAITRPPLK